MHLMFKKGNTFDSSPFQYGTMSMLESRILTYQNQMESVSRTLVGRVDGNKNILIRILQSITEEFTGDIIEFMGRVHKVGTDLSRTIGMTSNYGTGKVFKGSLYSGCDEIFIAGRNEDYMWTDLWYNWRDVASVTVVDHPLTEMTYFMPGVTNEARISNPGLCVFFVDIALLYTQWNLYRSAVKDPSMELFITEIVMPNMMKSHMDICMLNRLMLRMGLIEESTVRSNLPFKQISVNQEMDRILDIVERNLSGRRLRHEQFLSAIPCVFKENVLDAIPDPSLMPTIQSMWANLASKMKRVSLILELGKRQDFANMTDIVARLKRTVIRNESEKRLQTGLDKATSEMMQSLFTHYVTSRLPE